MNTFLSKFLPYQIVITKMSLSYRYQIVITKLSPYQIDITKNPRMIPRNLQRLIQIELVNCAPLSEVITDGTPKVGFRIGVKPWHILLLLYNNSRSKVHGISGL